MPQEDLSHLIWVDIPCMFYLKGMKPYHQGWGKPSSQLDGRLLRETPLVYYPLPGSSLNHCP